MNEKDFLGGADFEPKTDLNADWKFPGDDSSTQSYASPVEPIDFSIGEFDADVVGPLDADVVGPLDATSTPVGASSANTKEKKSTIAFSPTGLGKPLLVSLRSVYAGRSKKGGRSGELLVISTAKDPDDFAPSVVAVNKWQKHATPGDMVALDDGGPGSRVLYYSPSESATEISLSVQLKFDYFDQPLFEAWRDAAVNAAGLPVFLGGFLGGGAPGAAAGQALVSITGAAASFAIHALDRRIDGSDPIVMSWRLPIAEPGRHVVSPGWMLLTPDNLKTEVARQDKSGFWEKVGDVFLGPQQAEKVAFEVHGDSFYVDIADESVRHRDDGSWPDGTAFKKGDEVAGPFPYALVKVDGSEKEKLKKWKPAEVTAELASKFLGTTGTRLPALATDVFEAYANADLVGRVRKLNKKIEEATKKADAELYRKQRKAAIESITDEALAELVDGK